jgi:hypothetical protein
MGTVGQGLGHMDAPDALLPVEVRQGTAHLQDAMKAARREAHGVGGVADEGQAVRIGLRHLLEKGGRAGRIGGDAVEPQGRIALLLPLPRLEHPGGHLGGAFQGRRQDHVGGGHRRHLDDKVDAIQQRA